MKLLKFLPLFCLALVFACSSSRVVGEWKDPSYMGHPHRILVMGVSKNQTGQRVYEDTLAAELHEKGVAADPAYKIFPDQNIMDEKAVVHRVKELGYDAVLVSRVLGVSTETEYTPGHTYAVPTLYRTFWGNYIYGEGIYNTPGYWDQYRIARIETNLWDVQTNRIIWSAQSQSYDPEVQKTAHEVATLMADELTKRNLV